MELALGSVKGKAADVLLAHAANCDPCSDALRLYLEAADGSPSSEELMAIAEMAATQERWQDELAHKLASTKLRRRPRILLPPTGWITGVGAIAALVLCTILLTMWERSHHAPDHQLAAAYTEDRTLELRIPGAGWARYSPPNHTRGDTADQEPATLLDARARLARALEKAPQNAGLLELQARADVLNQKYDAAVDVLDRLIASGPVTAELLTDAASAYFERGLATGSELDRSTALEYIRRADEMAPADPVVLFNEGILMEDRGQVMNAVEVWNRYLTVERDSQWAAEGKRRLAALEQTLNRLKSHQSRVDQMLATPTSMNALAMDMPRLATFDEELATYELDRLLLAAYPLAGDFAVSPRAGRQAARASPCDDQCRAARTLLKALGHSLEIQHQDRWLTDLLPADFDSLPSENKALFSQALRLFANSLRQNLKIEPIQGGRSASESALLFHRLLATAASTSALRRAAKVGELRASFEQMLALQEHVDFAACRDFSTSREALWNDAIRYPWIHIVKMTTDVVCDRTPELRLTAHRIALSALQLAESSHYPFLISRLHIRIAEAAMDSGDMETGEKMILEQVKLLESRDSPIFRILNPLEVLAYADENVIGVRTLELFEQETLRWIEIAGPINHIPIARMELARLLTLTGQMPEAQRQSHLAYQETEDSGGREPRRYALTDAEMALAGVLLEQQDLGGAQLYLQRAALHMGHSSEPWELHKYAATNGQLRIEEGDNLQAARDLESEILRSEGGIAGKESSLGRPEFAEQDHDLYAELAAAWLAQNRPAEEVLALWERFRMRSRNLPVAVCGEKDLRCDAPKLRISLRKLGNNVLVGQIILLDRVLIYRADRYGVTWQVKQFRRQDVLASEQEFEEAVSSSNTTTTTIEALGAELRNALLPQSLSPPRSNGVLLIEPDPLLHNLAWAAIPTASGPLGLIAPTAEVRSILAVKDSETAESPRSWYTSFAVEGKRALVIGASMPAADEVPLPEAIEEAESVDRFLNAPAPLVGARATSSNIASRINSATILHFAGHALQRTDGTELLLASSSRNDRLPWIDGEFFREHPPRSCRLAVLSACDTGRRMTSWNHPFQDMVESLASAGVVDVVATRWQIDSEASVPFMGAFYSSLSRGADVPVALWSARRVLSSHSLYKSPYYWAAYFVTSGQMPGATGESSEHSQESTKTAENILR